MSDGSVGGEEVGCGRDPLDILDVPEDKDQNGTCDGAQNDTDVDGVSDGVETFCGTDPLDGTDDFPRPDDTAGNGCSSAPGGADHWLVLLVVCMVFKRVRRR